LGRRRVDIGEREKLVRVWLDLILPKEEQPKKLSGCAGADPEGLGNPCHDI
jgi:hypothetical protein